MSHSDQVIIVTAIISLAVTVCICFTVYIEHKSRKK